jgi:hypothetical protein
MWFCWTKETGNAGVDNIENESGSRNATRVLFCQNCNWLVKLILEFNSYIKIHVSLQRMILGSIVLWHLLIVDSSNVTNTEHFMGNILYAHSAYLFTLFTIHDKFSHRVYPYYHDNGYPTSVFSLLLNSPCPYVYKYYIIYFAFMYL